MNPKRRQLLWGLCAVPAFAALSSVAVAQGFPSKPVVLMVPQPAGGGADALCRTLQPKISQALGQQVVIDNRGGAAGNIGTVAGMAAPADGYTVTFVNLSTMALNPYLYAKPGYSTSQMQPVIWLTSVANLIVVNPERVKAKTMREFIEMARKEPGKYTYGTAGNGSGNHLGGEMLKSLAKIDITHVPYKGGAPAVTALLGGEIDSAVADPLAVMPHIKSGKLRVLAVTSAKRAAALPDVPTVAESGVPGYDATSWAGIVVPKGTPQAIVDKLYQAFAAALKAPENAEKLSSQLYEPVGTGPAEFSRFIAAENEKWSKLIKQLGLRID